MKIILFCFGKYIVESTTQNYNTLRVVLTKLTYKTFAILWSPKNLNNWFNNIMEPKNEYRASIP